MSRLRTDHAVRRRSRGLVVRTRSADPPTSTAVRALRVLGDRRTRRVTAIAGGDEYLLATDRGEDLLSPGTTPREHLRFLFFAAAVVKAVGASRVSLGADLEAVLDELARGAVFASSDEERACGAPVLPRLAGSGDRDSALVFTGDGFELRGRLETAVLADAIAEMMLCVLDWTAAGEDLEPAVREVVADTYRRHRALALTR